MRFRIGCAVARALSAASFLSFLLFVEGAARADPLPADAERQALAVPLGGRLQRASFYSGALQENRTVYVYTPPEYDKDARTYPVLIVLHGTPGEPLDCLWRGNFQITVDAAIRSHRLPPCIAVFPDGGGPFYHGASAWADSADGRCRMETAISRDLPQFLSAHYRVSGSPALWALAGVSEGGYGAANLVVRHPEQFRNAIVLSGEFLVGDDWPEVRQVFGKSAAYRRANSPQLTVSLLPREVRRTLHFYVAVGAHDDADLRADADRFVATLKNSDVPVIFARDPGAHNWSFWTNHLRAALPALGQWLENAGAGS